MIGRSVGPPPALPYGALWERGQAGRLRQGEGPTVEQRAGIVGVLAARVLPLARLAHSQDPHWISYLEAHADGAAVGAALPVLAGLAAKERRDWYAFEIIEAALAALPADILAAGLRSVPAGDEARDTARAILDLLAWHHAEKLRRAPKDAPNGDIPF